MKLSIITINYNNSEGLYRTINSVLALSQNARSEVEYIVVDGLSSDGSGEVIKQNFSRLDHVIIEKDNGIYDAINKGIRVSTGEYVLVLNSGDVLVSENLDVVLSYLNDNCIYYCDVDIVNGKTRQSHVSDHSKLTHRMSISHQGALVSRSIYENMLYDTSFSLSADFAFFNECLRQRVVFMKINEVIAEFEAGGRSDTKFFTSRFENLKMLYGSGQYFNMMIGCGRYIREAVHLGLLRFVD